MAPVLAESNAPNINDGRAVEDVYQKKTQLEHILLRPDTYIGSVEHQEQILWVHDGEKMTQKNVSYVPGLYKIFDEILVNAADNKVRDSSMNSIKVDVDEETGKVKVWNNGAGVPVEMHKKEGVYVPELIFGHLLTSSNYEDTQKKVTGGRNGYGAKLANIFSSQFTIETCDGSRQKRYKQVFKKNMTKKEEPKVFSCKATDNWTCVEFIPDFRKFGMDGMESDTLSLFRKRVHDLAGILSGVKVYYNGVRIPIKNFQEYVSLYLGPKDTGFTRVYEKPGARWEVVVSPTEGQHQQVSFVNSICTSKGGTHVKSVVDQICKEKHFPFNGSTLEIRALVSCHQTQPHTYRHLVESINKKNKNAKVKDFVVRNHMWVFVNCQIENPAFDSQTKETLTLKASSFGSKCELSSKFMDSVGKSGVADNVLAFSKFKEARALQKTDGTKKTRVTGIAKLDDANNAGSKHSEKCTLILTEGDSAKALAISGLSVVGRDNYGVFPLRGKLLNVRDATSTQVQNNAEISALKQIIGLQHNKHYGDAKALRYGKVMIMTDQDQDGSHIKGLVMNFLHHFYPSLLQVPGFLVEFITPIVKAKKGNQTKVFYTMPEYEAWKEDNGGARGWSIKYYKGLGTSTAKEAKEYFAALDSHRKTFVWEGDEDGESLELAFSKKKVEQRKTWLKDFVPGTFLDHDAEEISYTDFVHKELILFSRSDLLRSIPNMLDGLKPGQRKILFTCFQKNQKKDIKVAQLTGAVGERSAYHHGEASLQSTIVGLAQNYVGSNNINLLYPSGQFGTRLQGGKDAASARYIFTRMGPLTRSLFREEDDALLDYQFEEGSWIEPVWYMPILPMVLINGAEGIGTGWSTSIPNYNPLDVVANIRKLLNDEEPEEMIPWYRFYQGEIYEIPAARNATSKSFQVSGIVEQAEDGDIEVTELPLRKWTQDYKEWLDGMLKPDKDAKDQTIYVSDYKEYHTDTKVHFKITLTEAGKQAALEKGLSTFFKMQSKINTSNMVLFNAAGQIEKYSSPEHILKDFYSLRIEYYEKRRLHLLKQAQLQLQRISNKVRFILAVIKGDLKVSNRKKRDIEVDLEAQGFDRMSKTDNFGMKAVAKPANDDEEEEGEEEPAAVVGGSYDYLLSMAIHSLTQEKVESLLAEEQDKKNQVVALEGTTKKDMWRADLDQFEAAYNEWLAEEWAEANKAPGIVAGKAKKKAAPKKKTVARLSNDSADWAPAAKPAAAPKKKAAAAPAYGASTSKAAVAKPAPAKPAAGASAAPKKKAAPKAAPAAKELKLADVFAKATTKKAARPREEDSFSDSPEPSDFSEPPSSPDSPVKAPRSKVQKTAAVATKPAQEPKKPAASKSKVAPPKAKPAPKKVVAIDESDPESDDGSNDENDQPGAAASPVVPRNRPARGQKKTYVIDDSDADSPGGDGDDSEDFEEQDDDDDFDMED